ncbi:hypothetical protein [Methylobacterium durans]|uniref:Uncharacterized protein n=1 Tax=Methylobacterium durans TaxID=2202825 RepID=A0A2U8W3E6_9HYPH|nr:hypothetical protein [Methylobacterium durans]AWN40060.1 hypothetical protein DK389_05250 [Methylobacterium durans]
MVQAAILSTDSSGMAAAGIRLQRRGRRLAVLGLALAAPAAVFALGGDAAATEPDLARLIRFMALLKAGFALAALVVGLWRIARPAAPWREAVYLAAPALMLAGAAALWQMQAFGPASIVLHAGLFGFLAAALTDPDFFPSGLRRIGQAAGGGERRLSPTE